MPADAPVSYSVAQRIVHWLSVLLILFNLLLSETMEHWGQRVAEGWTPGPEDLASAWWHVYAGIAVFALLGVRLLLRLIQGAPPPPYAEPPLFRRLSAIGHGAFYVLLALLPITGLAAWFGGVAFAGTIHGGPLKLLMWLLLAVHVGAVLVHRFVWKTDVLDRMTRGVRP